MNAPRKIGERTCVSRRLFMRCWQRREWSVCRTVPPLQQSSDIRFVECGDRRMESPKRHPCGTAVREGWHWRATDSRRLNWRMLKATRLWNCT